MSIAESVFSIGLDWSKLVELILWILLLSVSQFFTFDISFNTSDSSDFSWESKGSLCLVWFVVFCVALFRFVIGFFTTSFLISIIMIIKLV